MKRPYVYSTYTRDVKIRTRRQTKVNTVSRHVKRQTRLDPAAGRIHDAGGECAVRGYTVCAGSGRIQGAGIGITDADATT